MLKMMRAYRKAFALVAKELDKTDASIRAVHEFYLANGTVPPGLKDAHLAYVRDPRPWRKNPKARLTAVIAAYMMARNEVYGPGSSSAVAKAEKSRAAALSTIEREARKGREE